MTRQQLFDKIKEKESFLCVGLDTDINRIPKHLLDLEDPIFEFNKQIIDATKDYAVAYKPNTAFYEAMGAKGWESLQKTVAYIPDNIFSIADAKRGDIGNTAAMYAKAFFETMNFDAVTLSPYMGNDTLTPYYEFSRKWIIILGTTSNPGAFDYQDLVVHEDGEKLFERIIRKSAREGNPNNTMYVVGATRPETLLQIRRVIPDHFLLIPGIGAQGGDLSAVAKYGMNKQCGLLVNSSRSIIYASDGEDFAEKAEEAAKSIKQDMVVQLERYFRA